MNLLLDVVKELRGMFLADANLSAAVLLLVGIVAVCIEGNVVPPLVAGLGLLVGCLAIIGFVTARAARRG